MRLKLVVGPSRGADTRVAGAAYIGELVRHPVVLPHVAGGEGAEEGAHVGRSPNVLLELLLLLLLPLDHLIHLNELLICLSLEVVILVSHHHQLLVNYTLANYIFECLLDPWPDFHALPLIRVCR
jgi:hypothetical protein